MRKQLTLQLFIFCACLALTLSLPLKVGDDIKKVDCHPDRNATQERCESRGCVWDPLAVINRNSLVRDPHGVRDTSGNRVPLDFSDAEEPWCYFKPDSHGYQVASSSRDDTGISAQLTRRDFPSLFGGDVQNIAAEITFESSYRLRVKIYDPNNNRYEVPIEIDPPATSSASQYDVKVSNDSDTFAIQVTRLSNGATIFDTSAPGFIFADQFLQITTKLSSSSVFGLGEHRHQRFQHDLNYRRWSLFSRDMSPDSDVNLYGVHPFYMQVEDDGSASGIFLKNTNAMEYFMMPDPAVTIRSIGGILDFYIFLGPTPEDVIRQYTETIGRSFMPPYWSLGFQLCRWGYNTAANMNAVIQRMRNASIPYDVQWNDIDYMDDHKDFTYSNTEDTFATLPDIIDDLHSHGQKYIIMLDPGIANGPSLIGNYPPLDDGIEQKVFVKNKNGGFLEGNVWPGDVYYPDFSHSNASQWLTKQLTDFHQLLEFDGLWIDMNEPSNFYDGSNEGCDITSSLNYPPYAPRILGAEVNGSLYVKTVCMDAVQEAGIHYNVHSMYGYYMGKTTNSALSNLFPAKRPFIVSRSQYSGSQKYNTHWLGDNNSNWTPLRDSIPAVLEYSLFGFPFVGPDICGFNGNSNEELCLRWMQLGAFYPFARNHNTIGSVDQDPAAFGDRVIKASVQALTERYRNLPYLYTLLFHAHTEGRTVARSLMHEYPADKTTHEINFHFLWGPALLITPVTDQGVEEVNIYFPKDTWYDYYSGAQVTESGTNVTVPAPLDGNVVLHVRGGYILPQQHPEVTTTASRKNPLGLLVALNEEGTASGDLYWDDGVSEVIQDGYRRFNFEFQQNTLKIDDAEPSSYEVPDLVYDYITIYGVPNAPTSVTADDVDLPTEQISYDSVNKVLVLSPLTLKFGNQHKIVLN